MITYHYNPGFDEIICKYDNGEFFILNKEQYLKYKNYDLIGLIEKQKTEIEDLKREKEELEDKFGPRRSY